MSSCRVTLFALASVPLLAAPASAQQKPTGAELIASKCFQCPTQALWQDQRQDIAAYRRDEALELPSDMDYAAVGSLSNEIQQKLSVHRPATLGQAAQAQSGRMQL